MDHGLAFTSNTNVLHRWKLYLRKHDVEVSKAASRPDEMLLIIVSYRNHTSLPACRCCTAPTLKASSRLASDVPRRQPSYLTLLSSLRTGSS